MGKEPRIFEMVARAPYRVNIGPLAQHDHNRTYERTITGINSGAITVVVFDALDQDTLGRRVGDFPCFPPYDSVWLEYESADPDAGRASFAMHVESKRADNGRCGFVATGFGRTGSLYAMLFQIVGEWDSEGRIDSNSVVVGRPDLVYPRPGYDNDGEGFKAMAAQMLIDTCYAFSLMGCANVKIIDGGHTDDGLTNRAKREVGRGHIAYKVLKVAVGKDKEYVLGRGTSGDAAQLPLHSVRGHFKTYTPERPLFGTVVGRFWWPAHARGNAENGEVRKSYRVIDATKGAHHG